MRLPRVALQPDRQQLCHANRLRSRRSATEHPTRNEGKIDPRAVADGGTATACPRRDAAQCRQYLAGIINIPGVTPPSAREGRQWQISTWPAPGLRLWTSPGCSARLRCPGNAEAGVRAAGAGIPAGPEGAAEAPADEWPGHRGRWHTTAVEASADATSPPPASEPPVQAAGVPAAPTVGGFSRASSRRPQAGPLLLRGLQLPGCQDELTSYAIVQIGTDLGSEANRALPVAHAREGARRPGPARTDPTQPLRCCPASRLPG